MDYARWRPEYERITRELGLSREDDERSGRLLERLLGRSPDPHLTLRRTLEGRQVLIVGAGSRSLPLPSPEAGWATIAADGATSYCLEEHFLPDLIVTDLDGRVEDEVTANGQGCPVLIHAHGDNMPHLEEWVPRFPGTVFGSVAGEPRKGLINFGGFTDGDRAIFLAEEMGAQRVLLARFDPEHGMIGAVPAKRKKLEIAVQLIDDLSRRERLQVDVLTSHGPVPWALRDR